MSKKAPVNKTGKSKRRLKRSVRRSIAALLMITAIGVAAVPVPENFADEINPTPSYDDYIMPLADEAPEAYDYSVGEAKIDAETGAVTEYDISKVDKTCQNSVTNPSLNDASVPAYKILQGGSGYPRLIWQFEFYKVFDAEDNNEYGIISRYNSKHIQSTIEIEASIVTDYVRIEYTDYADWYANADADEAAGKPAGWKGHNDDTYTCTDPSLATSGVTFLKKYFSADFEAHSKAWDTWNKSEDKIAEEEPKLTRRVGGDTDVPGASVTTNALTEEQKREYYCENETVEIRKGDIRSLEGYTLVQVIDESDPKEEYDDDDDKNDQYVYIPCRINMNEGDKRNDDANGFLAKGFTSINGIGDRVFQGVGNVTRLVTDEQYPLKYIGVSAFEGSYLQSIDIRNVKNISDRAFKGCTNLTEIEMGAENSVIGTEAFYGTYLRELKFGSQVTKIGPGAFAACPAIQKIDFSQVKRSVSIGNYAFYNTSSLSSVIFMASGADTTQEDFEKPEAAATVSISSIGDGAFAAKPVSSAMTNFTFPSTIQRQISAGNSEGLGDCVLAGRSGLQRVTMPSEFGQMGPAEVPSNTFYYCFNLECVKFPDNGDYTCASATYNSDELFASVNTDGFYVRGPKLAQGGRNAAEPRKATWKAKTAVSDVVPYLYFEKGVKYYEVSNGTYLLCINDAGYLTSCTIAEDGSFDPTKDNELVIPAKVGTTKVVGIIENCIWDPRLSENITKLTIEDDSISEVSAGVFKDWKKLKSAYIGDSITKIGDEAFKGCEKLEDVTFNTPKDYNYASFAIGKDAFVTGSSRLTFHGDIVKGYAPFDWAMDKNNIINKDEVIDKTNEKAGTRVCYKSLAPTYLTVMYNPYTDLVTLLDYPKYDELSDRLADAHRDEIEYYGCTREDKPYERMMEQKYYLQYGDRGNTIYEGYRRSFANLWQDAGDSRNTDELYSSEFYGPWIDPTFCANDGRDGSWKTYLGSVSADNSSKNVLTDWLFEPIVAYAADVDISTGMRPYFTQYPYSVTGGRNAYVPTTPEESSLILATEEILVPNGVGSIDVAGYYNNIDPATGKTDEATKYNSINISKYLQDSLDNDIKRMYFGSAADNKSDDVVAGLFSGYYNDGIGEDDPRGNDRVRRVVLESVQYLPDYAFDNCENLELVSIGSACSDIGSAPFRGCPALTNVNFNNNPKYDSANGIIYELNIPGSADSSLKIVECLAARGGSPADGDRAGVGDTIINSEKDPLITRVSAISEGAFEDCSHVVRVNLSDSSNLHEVPERAFRNCKNLREVRLPDTVNSIKRDAFEKDTPLEVTIPGKEVFIATDAFDPKNKTVVIRTYKDTSAYEYADYYDMGIEIISDRWRVKFLDSDGTQIGDAIYVEDTYPVPPASVPADPEGKMGYEFAGWKGWNGKNSVEIGEAITADTDFVAQYNSKDGMANGKYIVEFYTVFGDKVGETLYIEPGSDIPQDKIPNPPVYTGYVFDQWIPATFTNIQKSTTYIAGYKNADGSNATNPGGSTSGGSTNNDGNGGIGGNGSNGSTITQLYPTSGTSTSSGAVGKYTVTVINGSGSGTYDAGSTVIIAANTPASGKVFSKWTTESTDVTLASVSMSATTFVMPASNVTVTANYIDGIGANTVGGTVNNGNTINRVPTTENNGNTTVSITKPGISNKDLATANVNGSTDNFVVKISETDEATQAVINALTNKYGNMDSILYYAMDISLYDSTGTVKINDTSGLSVDITIPIPDALTVFGGNNMAGAVVSNQLEDLSERFTTINGVPCISFTATHFSPYTIYVNTQNLSEGMLDVTPKTGDPIHPKWFLSLGLACLSIIMFMKKDKKPVKVKAA